MVREPSDVEMRIFCKLRKFSDKDALRGIEDEKVKYVWLDTEVRYKFSIDELERMGFKKVEIYPIPIEVGDGVILKRAVGWRKSDVALVDCDDFINSSYR